MVKRKSLQIVVFAEVCLLNLFSPATAGKPRTVQRVRFCGPCLLCKEVVGLSRSLHSEAFDTKHRKLTGGRVAAQVLWLS